MADPKAVDPGTREWVLQEIAALHPGLVHEFVQAGERKGLVVREIVINFDTPNTLNHAGNAQTLNAPAGTVKAGDRVLLLPPAPGNRGIHYYAYQLATTDDQVSLQWFNADTVALDHAALDFRFLILHTPSGL